MATLYDIKDYVSSFSFDDPDRKDEEKGTIQDVKNGLYNIIRPIGVKGLSGMPFITGDFERGDIMKCLDGYMIYNGDFWSEIKKEILLDGEGKGIDLYIIPKWYKDLERYYFEDIFPIGSCFVIET